MFTMRCGFVFAALVTSLTACREERAGFHAQPDPAIGATSFVSAAGPTGTDFTGSRATPSVDQSTNEGGTRTIEEGDIYRVMGGGRVLNLNAYRGLQVIDVNDATAPSVIGALRMAGTPVELYFDGTTAIVLMNDWYGYWGAPESLVHGREQGGVVLLVDLADPTAPRVLDRAVVPGYLLKSRLARGDASALYVAATVWRAYDTAGATVNSTSDRTVVKSFSVTATSLVPRSELDLGGYVTDIQATPEALLVARTDWSAASGTPTSNVAVVDISATDGTMVMGADVAVAGQVKNQFDLDMRGGVLRVVSEGLWNTAAVNHLETFDVSDAAHPRALDHATFGDGQSLYATLFVGDDAVFCVTYLRQDPFHAFHLGADGQITERSAFIVSGWNDFFRAAFGETRLVGVGVDDAAQTRHLAISLYDITNLDNPAPLVDREAVELDHAWSEASWDHRAFTVLEGAVSVPARGAPGAPTVTETGLILLPFSGWDETGYVSGVQLFTFSPTTVTARGTLDHASPVRRAFLTGTTVPASGPVGDPAAEGAVAACLSDDALALHNVADPDAPAALGQVELAPNYPEVAVFGAYGLRHRETAGWNWWGTHAPPAGRAEVFARAGDPDRAPTVAGFDVAPGASLTRVGTRAVAMSAAWKADAADPKNNTWETTIDVWELADPTQPAHRGTLVTRGLPPYWSGWSYGTPRPAMDCFDCGGGYGMAPRGTVVGNALAFLEGVYETAPAGTQRLCVTNPPGETGQTGEPPRGTPQGAATKDPTVYYTGRVQCVTPADGPTSCYGAIYACRGLDVECVQVDDPASVGAVTECRDEPVYRSWTRWVVHVLDLSNPAAPAVVAPIDLPLAEEGVTVLAAGSTLWVATREPVTVADDGRDYVRYWVRPIDLTTPSAPVLGEPVNVPGALVAVDGSALYTLDFIYTDDHVESAISRSVLADGLAHLAARQRIADRQVQTVLRDGDGHILVSHGPVYWRYGYDVAVAAPARASADTATTETWETRLTVLDDTTLAPLGTSPVDTWATLRWAGAGRALFQVPGGLLVMDLATPAAPTPRAFFATNGWPEEVLVDQGRIWFAGGLYGLYAFDLDAFNLLAPAAD